MDFNYPKEAQLRPEMPEDSVRREIKGIEDHDELIAKEYDMKDCAKVYLESTVLEDLVGYTGEEVIERVDECYYTEFQSVNVSSVEYGNGWAILDVKE